MIYWQYILIFAVFFYAGWNLFRLLRRIRRDHFQKMAVRKLLKRSRIERGRMYFNSDVLRRTIAFLLGCRSQSARRALLNMACGKTMKIRRDALFAVNSLGEMMIASRHGDFPVKKGDKLAGTRIIPLVIEKEKMDKAVEVAGEEPIFNILPYHPKKVGIVTTGSEVKKGLIKDTFTPVLREKLAEYPTEVIGQTTPGDDKAQITADILEFIRQGADMVVCSGGMSVDPDDRTPGGIRDTGARVVTYGAPVLPGAMLLIAYYEKEGKRIPILGLPGCVMYAKRTVFDLVLPRIMADDEIFAEEVAAYGEGGLCLNCKVCTFPNCGFGK